MSESTWTVARQLISKAGQKQVWGIYRLELSSNLNEVIWKGLDGIEYKTMENGERVTIHLDIPDAMDLLANLKAALGVDEQ